MKDSNRTRVLLTGATGVLGAELLSRLAARPDVELVAMSRRGAPKLGVLGFRLGQDPVPSELRHTFDVIVHSAASTKWNLPAERSWAANVDGTAAALEFARPDTHFVHISTAFATGLRGDVSSERLADYRNTYEWSKAAAERLVGQHGRSSIVRPPLIMGRRSDGRIARFSGFYTLLRAAMTGLAPIVVASPDCALELTPVDDVADVVVKTMAGDPLAAPVRIGCGPHALSTDRLCDIAWVALNAWRAQRGVQPFVTPPVVTTERWQRFFLPFASNVFSAAQLRVIDLLSAFVPYMSVGTGPRPDVVVPPIEQALARAVTYWAEVNPRLAIGQPRPWENESTPVPA